MAELATAWGWTEQDVNSCVWYHVRRYVEEARKANARRLHDQAMIQHSQMDQVFDLAKLLEHLVQIMDPVDPRLVEAERLETWAQLATTAPATRASLLSRATYLRTCVKYHIQEGVND